MGLKVTTPITRLCNGWMKMGFDKKPADTRTAEELVGSINAWAKTNPEVKEFLPHLKDVPQKYLGLVADTIELANARPVLGINVNIKQPTNYNGKSVFELMLNSIPLVAKSNPNALDLTQEIINNTDVLTSKFALVPLSGGVMFRSDLAEHFKAAKPLVEFFAKKSFEHPNPMHFDNQRRFMSMVASVIDDDVDVKKVPLVKDIFEKMEGKGTMYIKNFVTSKVPAEKIKDNMSSIDKVAGLLKSNGKNPMDAEAFLLKNTNLY